jgi:hypothetical protein
MTPLDLARRLAQSDSPKDHALAVAIVARGLSDDDPSTFRQGWPLAVAVPAAIRYLGLLSDAGLEADALALAPTLSDAILNRHAIDPESVSTENPSADA